MSVRLYLTWSHYEIMSIIMPFNSYLEMQVSNVRHMRIMSFCIYMYNKIKYPYLSVYYMLMFTFFFRNVNIIN